jgi:hypothetical protein
VKNTVIICIILFLAAFISYHNSLNNNFIDLDDMPEIVNRPAISNVSLQGIRYLMLPHSPNRFGYRPVTHLSNMACYAVSGKFDPFFFRLMSVLANCLTVIACFLTVSLICGSRSVAFWTAILFAVHPSHTEAVNWIGSNGHLFAAFFGFLTIYFYVKKTRSEKRKFFYILSIAMFILANLSKESVILLPFLLFLYEYWITEKRIGFRDFSLNNPLYSILPFLSISAAFAAIHLFLFPTLYSYVSVFKVFNWGVVYKFPAFFMKYVGNALFPLTSDLAGASYLPKSFDSFYFIMLLLFGGLVFIGVYLKMTDQKLALFGIVFFVILLLPGIVKIEVPTPFSMRLLYFPSFGISLAICLLADRFFRNIASRSSALKYAVIFFCFFLLAGMAGLTIRKNENWYSSETIWSSLLQDYPDRITGLFRLSKLEADPEKRADLLQKMLSISEASAYGYPDFYQRTKFLGYYQLSDLYIKLNEDQDKIKNVFYEWHDFDPQNAYPIWKLGNYYEKKELLKKAQAEYENAVRIHPELYNIWLSLAHIYERQNLVKQAVHAYKEIAKRWPDDDFARDKIRGLKKLL